MGAFSRRSGAKVSSRENGEEAALRSETSIPVETAGSGVDWKVQEVVDTVARAATEAFARAEAEAASYLAQRRLEADREISQRRRELDDVTRALSARVERISAEATAFIETLDGAKRKLAAAAEGQTAPVSAVPDPSPTTEAPPARPDGRDWIPEKAMLRATQMAVAGVDRKQIEWTLRSEFGVADPARVVDGVLSARH